MECKRTTPLRNGQHMWVAYPRVGVTRECRDVFQNKVSDRLVSVLRPGVNVIKVSHLYFTRVAIVSLAENNSCTCKLQV